jgi:hypothetical protein
MSARAGIFVVAALVGAIALAACGSDDATGSRSDAVGTCTLHTVPPGTDLKAPVSFEKDVAPIFGRSCNFAACHGGRAQPLVLAAGTAHGALVGKPSKELPSMPYVTPGDPEKSFLMRKLDGDQCALDAECVGGSCKEMMPKSGEKLPENERDAIRRWIAQGAAQ